MSADTYGVVVFPFLKTRSPVSIGGIIFQPTDNVEGLPPEQAKWVSDISNMLFLKDDLRIYSASYAVVPNCTVYNQSSPDLMRLSHLQAAVSYLYGSLHPIYGNVFLPPEHASMVIFSAEEFSIYLVRPNVNVRSAVVSSVLLPDKRGNISGYHGLYNFKNHFWVASGSRLYGPQPQLTLNLGQDLSRDVAIARTATAHLGLLLGLLDKPATEFSLRIFTAMRWFNGASREAIDDDEALVNLSIAFEALLALPQAEKADRLVDSIGLLLGRIPRLGAWARQFYDARSKVVHEGRAQQLHFVVKDDLVKGAGGPVYQSLLTYGRQIFRLCLGTLLIGANLAEQVGLEEKLVTNQERFEKICKTLDDETIPPCDRLSRICAPVDAIERYLFVQDISLKLETMIGATRLAAKVLIACETPSTQEKTKALEALANAKRDHNRLSELEALQSLDAALPENSDTMETENGATVRKLVKTVWLLLFNHYFWLKQQG
jgi:hypothetical protein